MSLWNSLIPSLCAWQFLSNASEATVKPIETEHHPMTSLHFTDGSSAGGRDLNSRTASVPAGRRAASLPHSPKSLLPPSAESLVRNRARKVVTHCSAGSYRKLPTVRILIATTCMQATASGPGPESGGVWPASTVPRCSSRVTIKLIPARTKTTDATTSDACRMPHAGRRDHWQNR